MFASLYRRVRGSEFFASALSIGSGKLAAQVLSFIALPLFSRIYSPGEYGTFVIILSIGGIVASFAPLGLTSAIMAPKSNQRATEVLKTAIIVMTVMNTLFIGIVFALSGIFRFFAVEGSYAIAVIWLYLYLLTYGLEMLMYTYTNRLAMNHVLLINPLIVSACNIVVALPAGFFGVGYMGLFGAITLANLIASAQMIYRTKPFSGEYSLSILKDVFKSYREFVIFQFPANALGAISRQFPMQFLARLFENAVLGAYSMCQRVIYYPVQLIAVPMSTAFFRIATRYRREGLDLSRFVFKLVASSMILAMPIVLVVVYWGPEMFAFVLGKQWVEAGELASILVYKYVLVFCAQTTSYLRVVLGRQKLNLLVSAAEIVVLLLAGYIAWQWHYTLIQVVGILTVAGCINSSMNIIINFWCMKKYTLRCAMLIAICSILFLFFLYTRPTAI